MESNDLALVEEWFSWHAPTEAQQVKLAVAGDQIRLLARWLVQNVEPSRERSIALTELRTVRMLANQAIIFDRP